MQVSSRDLEKQKYISPAHVRTRRETRLRKLARFLLLSSVPRHPPTRFGESRRNFATSFLILPRGGARLEK